MSFECPAGFEHYKDVILRLGPTRRDGHGLKFQCPLAERHRNGDQSWSCGCWIGHAGALMARCMGCGAKWAEIVAAVGSRPSEWHPDKGGNRSRDRNRRPVVKPVLVATYQYRDRAGALLYEKLRWEPGFDGRTKSLSFVRPLPDRLRKEFGVPPNAAASVHGVVAGEYGRSGKDGDWGFWPYRKEKHAKSVAIDAVEPVLYRWPELAEANPALPVMIVEGEKDADLLRALGFVATCGPHGSTTWLPQWSAEFQGRRVCVVPDHNAVGYQHAESVLGSLLRHGVAAVRIVRWDDGVYDPGPGGGIGNWLPKIDPGNDRTVARAAVVDLCKLVKEYKAA